MILQVTVFQPDLDRFSFIRDYTGPLGIEPRATDLESVMLPLHHGPIIRSQKFLLPPGHFIPKPKGSLVDLFSPRSGGCLYATTVRSQSHILNVSLTPYQQAL